jgi:hypothetical protein
VIAKAWHSNPGISDLAPHHVERVARLERALRQAPGPSLGCPEQPASGIVRDPRRFDIVVQPGFEVVVGGDLMRETALLAEPDGPPAA